MYNEDGTIGYICTHVEAHGLTALVIDAIKCLEAGKDPDVESDADCMEGTMPTVL